MSLLGAMRARRVDGDHARCVDGPTTISGDGVGQSMLRPKGKALGPMACWAPTGLAGALATATRLAGDGGRAAGSYVVRMCSRSPRPW